VVHVQQVPGPEALKAQRQVVAPSVGAHQVLHHAVELAAARGVRTGQAQRRDHPLVEQPREAGLVRRIEQRHAGDQLGRRGVREEVVGDPNPVDETTLRQAALVQARPQLERGDDDVAAHRLAVDDGPARARDLVQEELAERDEVLDEPVRPVLPCAIAGGGPGVTLRENVGREGRRGDDAGPRSALDAVGVHHEPAAPVGRHLDPVGRAAERARPADRRGPGLGACGALGRRR
jgi:hypothetical protein